MTGESHFTEVAVNRLLLKECTDAQRATMEAHAAVCPQCASYLESAAAFDAARPVDAWLGRAPASIAVARSGAGADLPQEGIETAEVDRTAPRRVAHAALVPPPRPPLVHTDRRGRARARWAAAVAVLVTAASLLFMLVPGVGVEDKVLRKGSSFALEVFANESGVVHEVGDGDVVHPGDRLGFRVRGDEPGYVLVAGVDDRGNAYPCHPQSGIAQAWESSAEAVVLDGAVELDAVPGHERIVALWCPDPFAFDDIVVTLETGARAPLPLLRTDCAQREIALEKQARTTP